MKEPSLSQSVRTWTESRCSRRGDGGCNKYLYVACTQEAKQKKTHTFSNPCRFVYQNRPLSDTSPTANPIHLLISPHSCFPLVIYHRGTGDVLHCFCSLNTQLYTDGRGTAVFCSCSSKLQSERAVYYGQVN